MCGFELKRGQVWGPKLTSGRTWDHQSPFKQEVVQPGSLSIHDLGYFDLRQMGKRRRAGGYSLSRLHAGTALFTPQGKPLNLHTVLPRRVGQLKEMHVLVGARERLPMRLLLVRVPKEVADERREDLRRDAQRRQQPISEETLWLADWTILITDVPAKRLRFEEALVLLRERWQMELLYKLWKAEGSLDAWRSSNPWRVLCEFYAKLIGALLQHWLIVLFAWQDPQRSLVKLAQVVRDTSWLLMVALDGRCRLSWALRLIGQRMGSACQMNTRRKHPNSAQLLQRQTVEWPLSWAE